MKQEKNEQCKKKRESKVHIDIMLSRCYHMYACVQTQTRTHPYIHKL